MARQPNTDRLGQSFAAQNKLSVWLKGRVIANYDPASWRWDTCGAIMKWEEYGNRNSQYGWEIDHIRPVASGGGDDLTNLQPLNWNNNVAKGDSLNWQCPKTAVAASSKAAGK